MRNLIAVVIALGIIVGVLGIVLTGIALWLGSGWREPEYRSAFLSVPEIEEVSYFLWYEEHTGAGLVLTENRYLHIMEFDETVASKADFIELFQIGDIVIRCGRTPHDLNIASGVFNILEVMRASPLHLELHNIGDIVDHYAEISGYLEEELPTHALVNGVMVPGASKKIETRKGQFWCSRHTESRRP